jgi:phospholipid/cholesterol/gamma-HCH transport system substrate-binding protein
MAADRPSGGAALLRQRIAGLAFIGVLVGLVALSIAFYNKAFQPVAEVTLRVDRVGNQLTPPADVKVQGLVVGEARSVEATDEGAIVRLALDPDKLDQIPADVTARLLPKTLFGEKYVELVRPESPSGEDLADGDTISQDDSETGREFATALDNLLPLLETLDPESVSTTLNAVSTALRGRGESIGENLVLVRDYLQEFNPELPTLEEDFRGIADFADTLDSASPDFLAVLEDLSFVNRSLVDQRVELAQFLSSTSGVSGTFDEFLTENERRFVELAREGRAPLETFARYSPEFPCLAEGLSLSDGTIGDSFGNLQPGLHITLEFVPNNGPYLNPVDEPAYKDDRGPRCYGMEALDRRSLATAPGGQEDPADDINFLDGYRDELPEGRSVGERAPSQASASAGAPTSAVQGRALLSSVLAPVLGVSADEVPDLAHLLFGPVARGTVVGLSDAPSTKEAS